MRRGGEASVPAQDGGDGVAACVTTYEKRVSSLFANGPERKMQRQVVSTMQSWDAVLEERLPPQREVVRFVTWVFQGVRMTDEGVRGPGLPGEQGQAGSVVPPSPLGRVVHSSHPWAWKEMRRMLLGMVSGFIRHQLLIVTR